MGTVLDSLFPATRRALLIGFFRCPNKRFYMREIIKQVGKGQGVVQRELANLVGAGILTRESDHGRTYFTANRESPVFPELHRLIEKTAGITVVLERALQVVREIDVAFVFGSVAREEEHADSDVDLAVIGGVSFREVVGALPQAADILHREINPVVYSVEELRRRWMEDDHFVRNLVSGPKRFVVGTSDDLEKLVG
jgi:predicted nucleotidyltransferase